MSAPFNPNCYCDPMVAWGWDCDKVGCTAYAVVFFLVFLASTAEGCRRLWIQRRLYSKASFISTAQLSLGSFFLMLRHILLMAKVTEYRSQQVTLFAGFAFLTSAYVFILLAWCDIIVAVNFSKSIQRVFPVLKWCIIALNVIWFIGWIVAISITWPYYMTNVWIGLYGFGTALGYFIIGLIMWTEFRKVSDVSAHGQLAKETYYKMVAVARLTIGVVICAIIYTISMISITLWVPKSDRENVQWLFFQRITMVIFNYGMLIFWRPTSREELSKSGTAWSARMKEMEFNSGMTKQTNAVDPETGATFTSGSGSGTYSGDSHQQSAAGTPGN